MTAHRIETILREDGKLAVEDLPFRAGSRVEVIILAKDEAATGSARYPLRGKPYRFDDPNARAVPAEDWDANQ